MPFFIPTWNSDILTKYLGMWNGQTQHWNLIFENKWKFHCYYYVLILNVPEKWLGLYCVEFLYGLTCVEYLNLRQISCVEHWVQLGVEFSVSKIFKMLPCAIMLKNSIKFRMCHGDDFTENNIYTEWRKNHKTYR